MREVESWEELETLIKRSKLVLVLVFDSLSPHGRYLQALLEDFAFKVEPKILVVKADTSTAREFSEKLGSPPRLILFINGKRVWQQIGFFYNYYSDMYAIRRGILYALRSKNMSPHSLGISLR